MRKIILFCILLLVITTVSATTNLDFRLDVEERGFYPNEKIPLNVSVTNRDTFMAKNAELTVLIADRFYKFDLGDLKPSETFQKEITLPEFPAGTHTIKGDINYTGILDERFTEVTYGSFEVLFPPIKRYPRNVYVSDYTLPEKILGGKPYDVSITIKNDGDIDADLLIEFGSIEQFFTENRTLKSHESTTVKMAVQFNEFGVSLIEARAYALINGEKYLLNYRGQNTYVQPEKKAKLNFDRIELVNEEDNEVNQEDSVKFKVFIKNEGDTATNVNGELSSQQEKINVLDSNVSYTTIASKDSVAPSADIFELATKKIETGNYELNLKLKYVDSENRENEIKIPISVSKGGDICQKSADCSVNQECKNNKCVDLACSCGHIENNKCINYECCETNQCDSSAVCDANEHKCKKSGLIDVTVIDSTLSNAVSKAYIYINDELRGFTNEKGDFQASLPAGNYVIKVKARGYEDTTKEIAITNDKVAKIDVKLFQKLEIRFDVPQGFEKYVYATKAAWTDIHPQENRLMSYSFPLFSTNKVDVARDLIKVVDQYLNYDYSCLESPTPQTCKAWHKSEYDVIDTHSGVCYDWATLGTSFTDSYGIPARYIQVYWKYKSRTGGDGKTVGHAWQEIYLPELGGWKHLDTLWNEFDNPCIYANKPSIDCVYDGGAFYNPETSKYEKVNTYQCGKPLCSELYPGTAFSPTAKLFAGTTNNFKYFYLVTVKPKEADVTFGTDLSEEESSEIRQFNKNNTLNQNKIKENLLSIVNAEFKDIGEISDVKLKIENLESEAQVVSEIIEFKVKFSDEIDKFTHQFSIDQFSEIKYALKTELPIISLSPSTNQREITKTDKEFKWVFDNPGTIKIELQVKKDKMGFVTTDDPIINSITKTVANKMDSRIYSLSDNLTANVARDKLSMLYILGSYTEIGTGIENNIKKNGINTKRFTAEDYIIATELATIFWQKSDEAVVADLYDYDSIRKAEEYSIENKVPLLLIHETDIPNVVKGAITQLSVKKIILVDPNRKVSNTVISELDSLGKVNVLITKIGGVSFWQWLVNFVRSLFG